jgi:hypothetical protein
MRPVRTALPADGVVYSTDAVPTKSKPKKSEEDSAAHVGAVGYADPPLSATGRADPRRVGERISVTLGPEPGLVKGLDMIVISH